MKKKSSITLRELSAKEIPSIFPLVQKNKPGITKAKFTASLNDMIPLGYRVVAAFDGEVLVAISGFWLRTRFWCGRQLDIDNFFVLPEYRGQKLGERMIAWLEKRALKEKCELIVLDCYVDYFLAHRFYQRQGFVTTGFHFTKVPGSNQPYHRVMH